MTTLSFLDLVPIKQGGNLAASLDESVAMAKAAEALDFKRYWIAEHHNIKGLGSAATSLCISHVAAHTKTLRVGSGGIMLPNHAPLVIAEQFGTLDALYPGRIDLGVGRAPGGDGSVMQALRRQPRDEEQGFVNDIRVLQSLFADDRKTGVRAIPGGGADVPVYILGSSLFGAYAAAALGLPYAFASHFAPRLLDEALEVYRSNFQPSEALKQPYSIMAANIVCAPTDAEAMYLASSLHQNFVALTSGDGIQMPPPVEGYWESLSEQQIRGMHGMLKYSAIGSPQNVADTLHGFTKERPINELMLTCSVYDGDKRVQSLELAARAFAA